MAKKIQKKPPENVPPPTQKPHLIGYARVSMDDQTNRRQIDALRSYGVEPDDIYEDKASGKDMNRPGWEACWKDLRGPSGDFPGDTLVVHAIDRLGRDTLETLRVVKELHEKGCTLKVLTQDFDTRTPTGKMMFTMMASMAEWERASILERTLHGLAVAKAEGRVGGRKSHVTEDMLAEVRHLPPKEAARRVGLSLIQFKRRMERWWENNSGK